MQHSISSFNKLIDYFGHAEHAIQKNAFPIWQQLKLHKNHLERFQHYHTAQGQLDFQQLITLLQQSTDAVLDQNHSDYPDTLRHFDISPPLLLIKGDATLLNLAQIAIVGSRHPSPHGHKVAYDFADYFSSQNYITISGLATGIDGAAHQGAMRIGKTIAVIGTGLDQCYPKSHQGLQQDIVQAGGCIVTQFLPFTPPLKINFPKRNHIISAMSLGTLVVEAGLDSGSLITAKAAAEQGKHVFAIPGHIYSTHHQGCHQLIREGATLVDHPAQVIDDLTMFSVNSSSATLPARAVPSIQPLTNNKVVPSASNSTPDPIDLPSHLQPLYNVLDWSGLSLDALAQQLNLGASELNTALMELELLGLCKQHAGRYLRC